MVAVHEDEGYRSSGDESPAGISPPPRQNLQWQQQQTEPSRPSLKNRIIPQDDGTPYENSDVAPTSKWNEQTPIRPSLKNRLAPRDDGTPYENGDVPLKKSVSYKGSETDHTSVASFTSNDNSKIGDGNVLGSQSKLKKRDELQDVMKENLELMYDIVMQIREDKEYAKSIYRNCPRLQNLLDQHPDLRPLFEDPNLIRLNFEKVYRDAGGVFPEDEAKQNRFQKILKCIVSHPLFKVLKVLLFIKKIFTCITSGGMNLLKGCFRSMFWSPDPMDSDPNTTRNGVSPDGEDSTVTGGGIADPNAANKVALYRAADHMEDPKVQANMNELLQSDPDSLDDAIENDPELRALRDSNPLCAELMSDPETMKILTDPDNLRALADAPELIEQDFADPNWTPNELEAPPDAVVDDDNPAGTTYGNSSDGNNNGNNVRSGTGEQEYDEEGVAFEDSGFADSGLDHTDIDLDGDGDAVHGEEGVPYEDSGLEESGLDYNGDENGQADKNYQGDYDDDDAAIEDFELGESEKDGQNYTPTDADDNGYDEEYSPLEDSEIAENGMDYSTDNNNVGDDYDDGNALEDIQLAETEDNGLNISQHPAETNSPTYDEEYNPVEESEIAENGIDYTTQEDVKNANFDPALEEFEVDEGQENYGNNSHNQPDSNDYDGIDEIPEFEEPVDSTDAATPATDSDPSTAAYAGHHGGQKEKEREEGVPRSGTEGAGGIMIGQLVHGMADIIVSEAIGMGFNEMTGGGGSSDGLSKTLANVADSADYVDEAVEAVDQTSGANKGDPGAVANNVAGVSQQERGGDRAATTGSAEMLSPAASPKKSMGARFASTLKNAAKEGVASIFIGEDFSEMLVDRQERLEREKAAAAAASTQASHTGSSTEQGAFCDALGPQKKE